MVGDLHRDNVFEEITVRMTLPPYDIHRMAGLGYGYYHQRLPRQLKTHESGSYIAKMSIHHAMANVIDLKPFMQ